MNNVFQDCTVIPTQPCSDGIASSEGVVQQFAAMILGQGHSVEAQVTGEETTGRL